jgi:putative flavoprotein involved in K+ transport
VPAMSRDLPRHVAQVHSSRYRNPDRLPPGRVLVVGAGPSGQQIAAELARAGRDVALAAGGHRALPRRYRDRDVYWWMQRLGLLDRTVDSLPDPAAAARTTRSSVLQGGDEDLDLRRLHREGVTVTGRLLGVDGHRALLGDGLAADLADADANASRLRLRVDEHVTRTGLHVPEEPWAVPAVPDWATTAPTSIDLAREGVGAVVWATGYTRDWSWIHAPVFDAHGEPVHHRGVTAEPGLSFLGLRWLWRRDSGFISGVGRDAEHLADVLVDQRVGAGA